MASNSKMMDKYLSTFQDEESKKRYKIALEVLLQSTGNSILTPLSYYLNLLEKADEVLIDAMSPEEQLKLQRQLCIANLLIVQDEVQFNRHGYKLAKCTYLIDYIELASQPTQTPKILEFQNTYEGMPVSYCGIQVGQWMGKRILEAITDKAKATVEWMTYVNNKRLYWVWGGGVLKTVLSLLADDFYNVQNAKSVVNAPNQFTGYLSWILYFARFGLNTFLLIKETFSSERTAEELAAGKVDYWERFKTQWNIRKFTLLNDSIWGLANMVCFFWFTGSNGDALTIGLLSFDLFISIWDYEEQKTEHNKKILGYVTKIDELTTKLSFGEGDDVTTIPRQINALLKEKSKCVREWNNKKIALYSNAAYALGLIIAFTLCTMPFIAIPAATMLALGVIGAVMCFTLTVIANGLKSGLEIKTAHFSEKETRLELQDKIAEFKAITDLDDPRKILLYLEIKQLTAKTELQVQTAKYQTALMFYKIILQTMLPALMFTSLMFLTLGIGIAVLVAALALAVLCKYIIDKNFKPNELECPEFDNDAYTGYCSLVSDPELPASTHPSNQTFFQQQPLPTKNESEAVNALFPGINNT